MSTAIFSRKHEKVTTPKYEAPLQTFAFRKELPVDVEVKDVGEQRAILKAVRLAGKAVIKREFGSEPGLPLTSEEQAEFDTIVQALEHTQLPSLENPHATAGKFPEYRAAEVAGPVVLQALVELTIQADEDPTQFDVEPSLAKAMLERGVDDVAQVDIEHHTYSHAA